MPKIYQIALVLSVLSLIGVGMALGWSEPKSFTATENSSEEELPQNSISETENVVVEKSDFKMTNKSPWTAPNYAGQEGALGWSPDVFKITPGLQGRVNFWIDIYTKYTTDQGLLHDSQHVGVVYGLVDFTPIVNREDLTDHEKSRARKKLVDEKKNEIKERLARLDKMKSAEGLEGEDLRIWNLFSSVDEPHKFQKAMNRKQLRFQLGQKDRFIQGLYYSGKFLPLMEKVFREKGLPIELTRLPFVESSFNIKARSRVGASGIWQFMRYTGRRFMRINYSVDERNDPVRATEAAARLFRLNFEMLNAWPLAITGYNHGPAGVQRIIRKFKTENIEELVDERNGRFGFASANFYACFLAAVEVEKNAKRYFGDKIFWDSPLNMKEIKLTHSINKKLLLKWYDGDTESAKEANLHLSKSFWMGIASIGAKDFVRVPEVKYEMAMADLSDQSRAREFGERAAMAKGRQSNVSKVDDGAGGEPNYYMISHGETLSEISAQLGVSIAILKELNGIDNPRALRAGFKLLIPSRK